MTPYQLSMTTHCFANKALILPSGQKLAAVVNFDGVGILRTLSLKMALTCYLL